MSLHQTVAWRDVGGRVTDGADSPEEARSGRVVGSREGDGSLTAVGLVADASATHSANPNPGAPVPPLVPSAKKARFRILLYTGPYYKELYVPATSIGWSARLFLVIQKENFKKISLSLCKTRKRKPTAI